MTNNMDEFDQDQFETLDASEASEKASRNKGGLMEIWRSNPLIKLLVIMVVVCGAVAVVLSATSKSKEPIVSQMAKAPSIKEPPGGSATPFFIEQNEQANKERGETAMIQGGSAIPTPTGHDVTELLDKNKKDPMKEFREDTERLKLELHNEQSQNAQKLQMLQQQMIAQNNAKKATQEDDTLARAMQKQMQDLMEGWSPTHAKVVTGVEADKASTDKAMAQQFASRSGLDTASATTKLDTTTAKTLVPAGTVNYMQLLTEANSDIPGPILGQILSGPLAGGRAIGRFQVMNDYLVMSFNVVSLKGKDYTINALALDPDTTLGGMATEVDHRYLTRILLPAAGAFVSAFGSALADTDTTTTVSDGAVLVDNAKKGYKEAIYSGIGSMGQTMSQFFEQQANQTKTLVRVAVGTPMGLFYLEPVTDQKTDWAAAKQQNQEATAAADAGPYGKKSKSSGIGMSDSQMEMFNQIMSTVNSSSTTSGTTTSTRQ